MGPEKEDDIVMVSQEDAEKSDRWEKNYENLKKYKNKHGDCLVPKDYKDDPRLGNWMGNHRIPFRKKMNGKPSRLSNAQYDKLAMLGFEEVIKNKSEKEDDVAMVSQEDAKKSDRWDENYENLKKYKNKYGSCLVPKDYKDDPRLGNWVANHRVPFRKKMNGKPSRLSKVQYDKLAMLGFKEVIKNQKNKSEKEDDVVMVSQEDAKKSERWDDNYENLKKYKNKHGN